MSKCLLRLASNFKVGNRIVHWDELISSDTILNELAHALSRCRWPGRTFEEIRKELLRLHGRWKKQQHKGEAFLKAATEHTYLLTQDSEDEDDIFMPSTKGKSTASSKGNSAASSKGKSAASAEDDDDAFMWSVKHCVREVISVKHSPMMMTKLQTLMTSLRQCFTLYQQHRRRRHRLCQTMSSTVVDNMRLVL